MKGKVQTYVNLLKELWKERERKYERKANCGVGWRGCNQV